MKRSLLPVLLLILMGSCSDGALEEKVVQAHLNELHASSGRIDIKIRYVHYQMNNVVRENGLRKADVEVIDQVEEFYDILQQLDGTISQIENGASDRFDDLISLASSFDQRYRKLAVNNSYLQKRTESLTDFITSKDLQNRERQVLDLALALLRHKASLECYEWVQFQSKRIGGGNVLATISPVLSTPEWDMDTTDRVVSGMLKGQVYIACPAHFSPHLQDVVPVSLADQDQSRSIMLYRSFSVEKEFSVNAKLKCLHAITGDTLYYDLNRHLQP